MRISSHKKALLAGVSGTALQWYDFALFGYFAPIIASTYFPNDNPVVSLLNAFGILAVGYLLSPFGAMAFGYIGDRYGRKQALTLSILAMAIPTALISLVPGYKIIGVAAPILITLLRMIQGFVASAEFTGSTIFLVEHAPPDKKALYGCLSSSAYSIGFILAGLSVSFFTSSFMPDWGWRLSFALALLGGLLIFFLRTHVQETPEFQQILIQDKPKHPFFTAVKEMPHAIIGIIGIAWMVGIMTYGTFGLMSSYLKVYFHVPLSISALMITLALLVDAMLEPLVALLADKIGYLKIVRAGMIAMLLLSIPIFYLLSSGNTVLTTTGMVSMAILIAITYAPLNAYMVTLFPKQYRYSGFGVAYNIGISLFGGTAPLVMVWLVEKTGNFIAPAWYYILGTLIGLASLEICQISRKKINDLSVVAC